MWDSGNETLLAADVALVASGVGKGCAPDDLKQFLVSKGINPVEVVMMTKPEVVNEVRTLTFKVTVKLAEYEGALKPEVWPYRVAVRHFRPPRRDRASGTWQRQSEQSGGGQIDTDQTRGNKEELHSGAGGGGQHGAAFGGHLGAFPKHQLPVGHASRAGRNQQTMGKQNPGPIDIRNFFNVLSALGGEMGPPL